jgi:threonine dehydrogenase-like Zn-dependent dehydrogenase
MHQGDYHPKHTFPLSQAAEAYKLFYTNKTRKVVIVWR